MEAPHQRELSVLVPTGMLGFGFPLESFRQNLALQPHVIGVDAGSTDLGPHSLGTGGVDASRPTTMRDLGYILEASLPRKVPLVIGSAGTSGSEPGIRWLLDIIRELQKQRGLTLKVAVVHAEQDKATVKSMLNAGKVRPLGPEPALTEDVIDAATRIVGLMGVEPLIAALDLDPDIVLAGRCCDAAIFASVAIREGFPKGLAWHMGQILECGGMCSEATHGAAECLTGIIRDDHFVVGSPLPHVTCTPSSVAAQSFYEESHPLRLTLPGGHVWTGDCRFEQLDDGWVRVSGTKWHDADAHTVVLEGSSLAGYRSMMVAGIRDPILIRELDAVIAGVRRATEDEFPSGGEAAYNLDFIVYGRDGVMGQLEPTKTVTSHEVGLVIDIVARSQDAANAILAYVRSSIEHYKYKGIKATGANLATPMAPSAIPCGPVYRFCVHHLMETDDPRALFPVEMVEFG